VSGAGNHLQDGGVAVEALHLDDVLEADLAQHAAEAGGNALLAGEFAERGEDNFQVARVARFLQKKFRALSQAGGAGGFVGVGAERDFLDVGIFSIKQRKELDAVNHGHLDIHDREINGLFLQDQQRLAGVLREEYLPFALAPAAHDALDHLQELEIVVHEEDLFYVGG